MNNVRAFPPVCKADLCRQGKHPCPTPQACQVPEADDTPRRCLPGSAEQLRRVLLGGLVLLFAIVGLVHTVARFF